MSFFRGFFGAIGVVFGFAFAIWVLKIIFIPHVQISWGPGVTSERYINTKTRKKSSSASKRLNGTAQDIEDGSPKLARCAIVPEEKTWAFDAQAFDTLKVIIGNGRCTITGDDSAEDITVKTRIEASSGRYDYTQKLLDQTRVVADKDLKNKKIELSLEEPRSMTNAHVNWTLVCPNDTALTVEAKNGHIIIQNLESAVDVRTNNGQIDVTTPHIRESVSYQTDNGKISLEVGQLEEDAFVSAQTKNGAIFLNLPSEPTYNIAAKVYLGLVMSSYPVTDTVDENTQIALETNNGMIYIQ